MTTNNTLQLSTLIAFSWMIMLLALSTIAFSQNQLEPSSNQSASSKANQTTLNLEDFPTFRNPYIDNDRYPKNYFMGFSFVDTSEIHGSEIYDKLTVKSGKSNAHKTLGVSAFWGFDVSQRSRLKFHLSISSGSAISFTSASTFVVEDDNYRIKKPLDNAVTYSIFQLGTIFEYDLLPYEHYLMPYIIAGFDYTSDSLVDQAGDLYYDYESHMVPSLGLGVDLSFSKGQHIIAESSFYFSPRTKKIERTLSLGYKFGFSNF